MTNQDIVSDINQVQLHEVYVHSVQFQRLLEPRPLPPESKLDWSVDVKAAARQPNPHELRIKLGVELQFKEGSPAPYKLSLDLVGVYHSEQSIDAKRIPSLVATHSGPLLWPYLREMISDLTTRAGGPTIMLPTLRIALPQQPKRVRAAKSDSNKEDVRTSDQASDEVARG